MREWTEYTATFRQEAQYCWAEVLTERRAYLFHKAAPGPLKFAISIYELLYSPVSLESNIQELESNIQQFIKLLLKGKTLNYSPNGISLLRHHLLERGWFGANTISSFKLIVRYIKILELPSLILNLINFMPEKLRNCDSTFINIRRQD
jgi:hypothetical protein